jgi:hypothetical protein
MKAGWVFTPAIENDGTIEPYFPAGMSGDFRMTSPIDIHRLTGSAVPHVHYLTGAFAIPNMELGDNHWHAVLRAGEFYQQYTIGAAQHTHDDLGRPTWFNPFVICSDADAVLIANDPQCHIAATCPIDAEGVIGPEDETPWTTQERNEWSTRFLSGIGIQLTVEVDRPSRLVLLVVALNARQYSEAAPLRPTSV